MNTQANIVDNILLVTNEGWFLNDQHFYNINEVRSSLTKLPKNKLTLACCKKTEHKLCVESLNLLQTIESFEELILNSDFNSDLCKQ